ncbi:MAG TPA: peptidyl-prolyl cis-trans isomerase [Verrucomicrobiae bacterium]|nr:peptidyl-prolyl cis-trans isomerase [Verrucomicrobiae bacterium]
MRATTIVTAVCLGLFASRATADLANGIEAVVDDSVITYHEVTIKNPLVYEDAIRQLRNDRIALEQRLGQIRGENLDLLIKSQLILHDFKTSGYGLPESVLDDIVQERIKSKFGDEATLTRTLKEEGLTKERFRAQIRDQFIIEAMRAKNVSQEIIISPHKVEAYYQAHKDEFKVEDQVKLRAIVLRPSGDTNAPPADQLANDILLQLNEGAAFDDLAKIYSQGDKKTTGGEWGWYEQGSLSKGLADIAHDVPTGKYSKVFSRTAGDDYWIYEYQNCEPTLGRHYGLDPASHKQKLLEEKHFSDGADIANLPSANEFYLLQVEDRKAEHYKPLNDVRDLIEKNLTSDERGRLEQQWLDKLRKKTFVKRYS